MSTRRRIQVAAVLLVALALVGCSSGHPTGPLLPTRSYRMGFSGIPPRPDFGQAVAAIQMWVPRADAALLLHEPPWDSLLAGVRADTLVLRDHKALVDFYRAHGLRIVASIDPTNGLNRAEDAAPLVAAGRSLTESAIRALYRDWVVAIDTLLAPDDLSLASETNLVRLAAPAPLYAALVQNAAEAAAAVRAVDPDVRLFTTVQVEVAWGRLGGTGAFVGIAQDRADFSFAQAIGLSSYPYLGGFAEPELIPDNYYARLIEAPPLPMMVIEGGWHSESVDTLVSSPAEQRRYLVRHSRLLGNANAVAWFQITFTDLDPAFFPPATILPLFATLGLVDVDLNPKPALSAWDSVFAMPRR